MRWTLALLVAIAGASGARADEVRLHAELDPLPFVRDGYGGQIGARTGALRLALASFALDVPDFAAQLGGNDEFHVRVRPSAALYVLVYPARFARGRDGFAIGGAMRYLRLRYTHDALPDVHDDVRELSPEVIVGYQWHPTRYGFYVQPWFGLAGTLYRSHDPVVGDRAYDPLPLQAFFTVNLGWELVP